MAKNIYEGDWLQVLSPRTVDGNVAMTDEKNQVMFKEAHLPITAKAPLEEQNRILPKHLQKQINIIKFVPPPPPPPMPEASVKAPAEQQSAAVTAQASVPAQQKPGMPIASPAAVKPGTQSATANAGNKPT